ncbi:MAG: nucleoside hydrolase [Anaerolineales bacterium]|jgi:purine nucleosidase
MNPKRIIIDTDPGIDDSLAILLALASPEIQLEALTVTQGNVTVETGTHNALAVLELLNASHIPVAQGCSLPIVNPLLASDHVHGESGLGNAHLPEPTKKPVHQHAIDYLIERFLAEPGEISLFAIGPLTNVALAIRKEPRIAGAVKEMVIMGGAIREGGNITPQAEFNIYADPHAAHVVFHSGIPITLIPLDVTQKCMLYAAQIEKLNLRESSISRFIADSTVPYINFTKSKTSVDGCALHDPLTLATVIAPELFIFEEHYVDVDISSGPSTGSTFADFYHTTGKPANMRIALDVRGEKFVELFLQHMEVLITDEH